MGTTETGALAGQDTLVAESTLRAPDRAARRPRRTVDHAFAQPEKWLIGVPFRPTASRVVWMYYVVDEAGDVAQAVHAALERANSAPERHARGGGPVTAEDLEVRRIMLDALGHMSLDGSGERSAAPSWWGT